MAPCPQVCLWLYNMCCPWQLVLSGHWARNHKQIVVFVMVGAATGGAGVGRTGNSRKCSSSPVSSLLSLCFLAWYPLSISHFAWSSCLSNSVYCIFSISSHSIYIFFPPAVSYFLLLPTLLYTTPYSPNSFIYCLESPFLTTCLWVTGEGQTVAVSSDGRPDHSLTVFRAVANALTVAGTIGLPGRSTGDQNAGATSFSVNLITVTGHPKALTLLWLIGFGGALAPGSVEGYIH